MITVLSGGENCPVDFLDRTRYGGYTPSCIQRRGVEQLVARWAHNPKVGGSSPSPAPMWFEITNL